MSYPVTDTIMGSSRRKTEVRVDFTAGENRDLKALKTELGIKTNHDAIRFLMNDYRGIKRLWEEMKQEWNVSTYALDRFIVPKFNKTAQGFVASILSMGGAAFYGWSAKKRDAYKQFLMSDMKPEEIEGAMVRLDELLKGET